MKQCKACLKDKELTEYSMDTRTADYRASICKDCVYKRLMEGKKRAKERRGY